MNWFTKFLTSSIGQKLIMSLTGLFLILFLVVHLAGNLQLLFSDGGEAFNTYAYKMTHNPIIKTISYGLYALILVHAVQGIALARRNRAARGSNRYAVKVTQATNTSSFAANNMALLGILVLAFLFLHMGDFWWAMKMKNLPMETYEGNSYQDLYVKVYLSYKELWVVIAYLVGLVALAIHLWHGFQSAFQTLGLNHRKYSPAIRLVGKLYAILIPVAFAIIPIYFYFSVEIADPALAERVEQYSWWLGQ
ncbi:MAG: succinate dehydrogenase cytochrome b subunit [Bacteroidetes bacterium]|nr:succinate dehydrogenase cytochrome b subunit [Bacteroidota bacterium]